MRSPAQASAPRSNRQTNPQRQDGTDLKGSWSQRRTAFLGCRYPRSEPYPAELTRPFLRRTGQGASPSHRARIACRVKSANDVERACARRMPVKMGRIERKSTRVMLAPTSSPGPVATAVFDVNAYLGAS